MILLIEKLDSHIMQDGNEWFKLDVDMLQLHYDKDDPEMEECP